MSPVDQAVALLRAGELIGLPTETVYGLAADAGNPSAVKKIFALKGRPANHPLILHIAEATQLANLARLDSPQAALLAAAFWPGPLTLVLPKQPSVDERVTGGQQTVAVRMPAHPLARQVLAAFGGPLAAPSANRFGRISPTSAAHVREEFGDELQLVLEGGDCELGLESTIVSLVEGPELLRPGSITVEQIETVLGATVAQSNRLSQRAPGLLSQHYAPRTTAVLIDFADLSARLAACAAADQRIALMRISEGADIGVLAEQMPNDPVAYGHKLYAALRRMDNAGAQLIIIERPPTTWDWLAVNDRLTRATGAAD